MKKQKYSLFIVLFIISCLSIFGMVSVLCFTVVKYKAENYLCEKYGAQKKEIELIDYSVPHFSWHTDGEMLQKLDYVDYSFEYCYKGRNFIVCRDDNKSYYDDYQLEEIEEWSIQWLNNNIDENIIGVEIDTSHICLYQNNFGNNPVTQKNISKFLSVYLTSSFPFIHCLNVKNYENIEPLELKKEIDIKISNRFNIDYNETYYGPIKGAFSISKLGQKTWYRYYE